jgi:hypothetical protein
MSSVLQRRRGVVIQGGDLDEELPSSPEHSTTVMGIHGGVTEQPTGDKTWKQQQQQQQQQQRKRRKRIGRGVFGKDFLHICSSVGLLPILFLLIVLMIYLTNHFYQYWTQPRLPIPHVDIPVPSASEWPLIHIVNTRFMQEQGALSTLGMARFHLFMTFCFPTMIGQSTQSFFWIIKTDPQFTKSPVFPLLIEAVQSARDHHQNQYHNDNIYIVASNNNFMITPGQQGSWADGAECIDLLQSKIYTGNVTKLRMAMALRKERPILETRLDADDGLHMHYIKYLQYVAMRRFQPATATPMNDKHHHNHPEDWGDINKIEETSGDSGEEHALFAPRIQPATVPQWLYWCTRRHLEWHSLLKDPKMIETFGDISAGVLAPIQHDKLCITPGEFCLPHYLFHVKWSIVANSTFFASGMTVGFNVGVDPTTVPVHSHDQLYAQVSKSTACYPDSNRLQSIHNKSLHLGHDDDEDDNNMDQERVPCLDLVEDLLFCALRSRTLTSAGMLNVGSIPAFPKKTDVTEKVWQLLGERFNVNKTRVRETQTFLNVHRKEIAYENILGQCTTGHSCKEQAKAELQRIIAAEEGSTHTSAS